MTPFWTPFWTPFDPYWLDHIEVLWGFGPVGLKRGSKKGSKMGHFEASWTLPGRPKMTLFPVEMTQI